MSMIAKPVRKMTKDELIAHFTELSRQYSILTRNSGRTGVTEQLVTQRDLLAEAGAWLMFNFGCSFDQISNLRTSQQEEQKIG